MAFPVSNTKNSWSQVKNSAEYEGNHNFISSIVYSPDDRFGLTICFLVDSFTCRLIEMATGEFKQYRFSREGFTYEIKPVGYYFVNPRQFVVVTYDENTGFYTQQIYLIDTEKEEIRRDGYPLYLGADSSQQYSIQVNEIRGCGALKLQGQRFLVLPSFDGLLLTPWNPLSWDPTNPVDKSIYLCLSFSEWEFKKNRFDVNVENYHCFGSKVYFTVRERSAFRSGEDGEEEEILSERFDRFVTLDLAEIDLNKGFIVLNEESAKLSVSELAKTTTGDFSTTRDFDWSQDGKYLIAEERREVSSFAYKRPATKKRIYVIDLENQTTSLIWARTRVDSLPTVYNGSLLVWRSRLPVERRGKMRDPRMEYNIYTSFEIIYEFKTISIPNKKVYSLLSLTKNLLLLGRNTIKLSDCYITRFFES